MIKVPVIPRFVIFSPTKQGLVTTFQTRTILAMGANRLAGAKPKVQTSSTASTTKQPMPSNQYG
jgi:hypothetical protein